MTPPLARENPASFVLPRGVTGFYGRRADEPGTVDAAVFTGACFAAVRPLRVEVTATAAAGADGVVRNFHHVLLRRAREDAPSMMVLCNAHAPLLALADPLPHPDAEPAFRDHPDLAGAFHHLSLGFTVLAAALLEQPVAPERLADLNEAERSRISFWRPQRLGDVLFNHWD